MATIRTLGLAYLSFISYRQDDMFFTDRLTKVRIFLVITFLLSIRLFCLQEPALLDPTEARYATIALRMVKTGQWIVPEINRGDGYIPFWGKPPLHFWLTAISFKFLGFNEFAARLPSFLALIGVCFLIYQFTKRVFGEREAVLSPLILLSTPLFTFLFGTCIVDTSLTFFLTGAMVSFALAVQSTSKGEQSLYSMLFFVSVALGFMVKGPLSLALPAGAILLWCLQQRNFSPVFKLGWVRGGTIFLLLTAPWFLYAEYLSPGLLSYFFIHENFLRFITPDYGDLYGTSHQTFRGVTILLLCLACIPWTFLPFFLKREAKFIREPEERQWMVYTLSWGFVPALFFLSSNNVIITYLLPGIPALAIVAAVLLERGEFLFLRFSRYVGTPLIWLLLVGGMGYLLFVVKWIPAPVVVITGAAIIALTIMYVLRIKHTVVLNALSVHTIMIYSLGLIGLLLASPMVSDTMSTKTILDLRTAHGENGPVQFVGKLPYSASFYLERNNSDLDFPRLVKDGALLSNADLLMKRTKPSLKLYEGFETLQTESWASIDFDNDLRETR